MKKYQEWAKREYSLKQRMVTLALAGVLVLLILPSLVIFPAAAIDRWLQLPRFTAGALNLILGLMLAIGGLSLGLWSVETQISLGRGTPVPIMPTQKLIAQGPFAYCRNPMTLGTILAYLGLCVWLGSLSALVIVLILAGALLSYIKFIEEKELEARFGQAYLEYKRSTPFILPRLRPRT